MDLKTLMVDTKAVWIKFPGLDDFEVQVVNLSRKELTALRKGCTITKFDRKTRQSVEEINEEKFVEKFTEAVIKSWKGLKLSYLENLLLVDIGDQDPDKTLPFTKDNAETLVTSSNEFDTWLNEVVFDLENFRTGAKKSTDKETREVSS